MRRRRAIAGGLAVAALYVAAAAWSGALSPLARGPLLDGLGPPQAYRWVSPPPELAATNVAPSALTAVLPIATGGVKGGSSISSDSQVTVIVTDGSIAPHANDTSVRLDVTPVDPATLAPPPGGRETFGNAYRIAATYLPSKTPVRSLRGPLDVVLVYPVTVTLHATRHDLLASPDGQRWSVAKSTDSPAIQQVEAPVDGLGYVQVAAVPTPAPISSSPASASGGSNTVAVVLFALAGVVLLLGIGLILRNRRS